ncbi:MAG: zinc ribbon domain-containing protein [Arachnia sp.]
MSTTEWAPPTTLGGAVQVICGECGAQNEANAEFCSLCRAFLAWDEPPEKATATAPARQAAKLPLHTGPTTVDVHRKVVAAAEDPREAATSPQVASFWDNLDGSSAGRFRAEADQDAVDVVATGEPTLLQLRIANTSSIVDGYAVETPGAPAWLHAEADQIQLLPGAEAILVLRLRILSDTLVPAQEAHLTLRVTSLSQAPAHVDVRVSVAVPALDVPVRVHAEPSMVRTSDRDSADCVLLVDNSGGNRPVDLRFTGSDPEMAVRFAFDPPKLQVAPGATASIKVTLAAARPEAGQVISRSLTVRAHDGPRTVETLITLQQSTTRAVEDPLVRLQVLPSMVRVEDGAPARVRVVADNRAGAKWTHLRFTASDPEGVVNVIWFPSDIDVPPGKAVQVDAILEAPQPKAGAEVSRTVTVSAMDGPRISTAVATLVQVTSASPMATLKLRVEPSIVRVHDVPSANVQVHVDNQRGRSPARVSLSGTDPEQAIGFTMSPDRLSVAPGHVETVALRLDAWCPPPGQEVTRQFTVVATDGETEVDAAGTFVQTASREAIEVLAIRLDPSVLRMTGRRRGIMTASVDNRAGAQPVRVALSGDDPENAVEFTFLPRVLDVPAATVVNSRVTMSMNRAPGAVDVTRPFTISASDGRSDVQVAGELVQAAAPSRLPLARVLFTVFGGLAMVLGAFLPWYASSDLRGVDLDAGTLAGEFITNPALGIAGRMVSAGLVFIVIAGLTVFGLTGRTGRLTRLVSMLGALALIGLFVALAVVGSDVSPGAGAYLTLAGCVLGYVGGLLVRR